MSALAGSRADDLRALAGDVRAAFLSALAGFSLRALVADALPPLPPKRAAVRVVAIGKAALPMMLGALDRWPDRIDRGLVVTVGSEEARAFRHDRVVVRTAAHPYPDERSAGAAEAALAMVHGLAQTDLALVLVSGGASSLVSLPPEGMTLDDKRALVRDLLSSGASIRDVNLVRRHLSRIKGGRLAAAAAPARVLTLAVSDVIGGGLHDIGSGPSGPDPTTLADARRALERFAPAWSSRPVGHDAAEDGREPRRTVHDLLSESLKPAEAPRWRARLVAAPATFAERVAAHLRERGLDPTVLPGEEAGAAETASRRVEQARSLPSGRALVIPCEPTVRIPADHGHGGRAGWVALRALLELPPDVALLCGATDGVDGSSGTAGAVVTALDREGVPEGEIDRALAAFDDASAHGRLGSGLPGAPTGLNFTDVHIVARLR